MATYPDITGRAAYCVGHYNFLFLFNCVVAGNFCTMVITDYLQLITVIL